MDKAASVFLRRDIHTDDPHHIIKWLNNTNVTAFLSDSSVSARELEIMTRQLPDYLWAMQLNSQGIFYMIDVEEAPAGFIKLVESGKDEYEIVVTIGEESAWGIGFGTDAVKKCLYSAFFDRRAKAIAATIHNKNERSIRLFEKLKFERSGIKNGYYKYLLTFDKYIA
ncbi:MAG TPA: GNAT family protein [Bacillota bacterium]|nr:GNAT family protein [Bacillota bacterium]